MKRIFDSYSLIARLFPSLLSLLPLFISWFYLRNQLGLEALGNYLGNITFFGEISLSLIILYAWSQLVRTTSKRLEERYFTKSQGFPTTYMLLTSGSGFSLQFKEQFRERVSSQYGLSLISQEKELTDLDEAKKRINDAIRLIIRDHGDNPRVRRHNIWYGFSRNLCGGAIYGFLFSVVGVILGKILGLPILSIISLILALPYAIIVIFRKEILVQHGEAYARELVIEFMHNQK